MIKPGDQASAGGPGASGPGRQHQSHPEETEEELREHQALSSSSSSSSYTSVQDTGLLRGLVIKQEPPDPQELEEREQRERQTEQDFLFRQVSMNVVHHIIKINRYPWERGGQRVKRGMMETVETGWAWNWSLLNAHSTNLLFRSSSVKIRRLDAFFFF